MKTNKYLFLPSLLSLAVAGSLRAQTPAATELLQTLSLPSQQETVRWTNLTNTNPGRYKTGQTTYGGVFSPAYGTGTIEPISPGYPASFGFYSFSGDFGIQTSTATSTFDIDSVVLQIAKQANPDWTLLGSFIYNPANPDFSLTSSPEARETWEESWASSGGNPNLAWFGSVPGYIGGPLLSIDGGTSWLAPTLYGYLGEPIEGGSGSMVADYYSFAWQWDLSAVDDVSSITIAAPIIVHESMLGAQIDLGSEFQPLAVSPVPEPSISVGVAGGAAFLLLLRRRHARA